MLLCSRKRLKILDVNCLPLSCKIFLGFPLTIIQLKAKILDRRCEILAEAKWKNALRTNHDSNDGQETNNMT